VRKKRQRPPLVITNLVTNGSNITAIALQEVWAVPYPELVKIEGFTLVTKIRNKGRGDGIGFYIKENLKFRIIEDLSTFTKNEFEALTVEITLNNKKSAAQ
jgi:hypothetical protein